MNLNYLRLFMDPGFNPVSDTGVEADGITLKPGWERNEITGAVTRIQSMHQPPGPPTPPAPNDPPGKTPIEGVNTDGTLMDGYEKDSNGNVVKITPPEPIKKEEALDDKGELKPGYIANEDGTYAIDPDYDPNDTDPNDETGMKFIGAVETITGRNYQIEYPENVHPTSPEGMAFRENVIRETAERDFEEYLKKNDPRSYAYMLHRQSGGTDEDFFNDKHGFVLPTKQDMTASADMQAEVYRQYFYSMGLGQTEANLLVDAAVKDNTLAEKSTAAWEYIDSSQQKLLKELSEKANAKELEFANGLKSVTENLSKAIKSEIEFTVPETDQQKFLQFMLSNMRYDNGKFFIVQEVGDSLKTLTESLFFQYKNGNLNDLIRRQVNAKAAHQLRLSVKSGKQVPGSGSGIVDTAKKNLPLSAILPKANPNS